MVNETSIYEAAIRLFAGDYNLEDAINEAFKMANLVESRYDALHEEDPWRFCAHCGEPVKTKQPPPDHADGL
jgi:hypothetical protein